MARSKVTIDQVKNLQTELDGKAELLNDLTDVVLSSPAPGEVLKFDGTNWVNQADLAVAAFSDLTDVDLTGLQTGQTIKWNGTKWVPVNEIAMYQQSFVATASQTVFSLTVPAAAVNISVITVNGIQQRLGTDYTLSGSTLTFLYALTLDDEVIATYFNK